MDSRRVDACPHCGKGTVRSGFCDYCGMAPPPLVPGAPPTMPWPGPSAPGPGRGVHTPSRRLTPYGLLEMAGVPPVPYRDPERATLPVAGGDESVPPLRPGEMVGGQYEVQGCLAHGGQGRIYIAHDNNVGHWVVLKGLLDTRADAVDVPESERAALASVSHPNIVKIHNFVRHPAGAKDAQRYIVMEYVGGRSLQELLDDRRRDEGPEAVLPLDHVIAYGIEMLWALNYLHARRILYCDLKPANVMQCEQRITLIDLGAAWRMDGRHPNAPIYGTQGFGAPELPAHKPSIGSDLYTVGRTMAVLSFDFDYTGEFEHTLPARDEVPVLKRFDSYDRLLRRATHPDPARRFGGAAEMAEQLFGVLREVMSVPRNADPWPVPSRLFGRERVSAGTEIASQRSGPALGTLTPAAAAAALPIPAIDELDPNPELVELTVLEPEEIVEALTGRADEQPPGLRTEEKLVLIQAHLDLGRRPEAEALLTELTEPPRPDERQGRDADWRIQWYLGVSALIAGEYAQAEALFDDLYDRMPGEAAPKLALAFCCEGSGGLPEAARRYESVWRTDRGYLSAAFGLARVRLAMADRSGAVDALDDVPSLSSHYGAAQLAAMAATLRGRPSHQLRLEDLRDAAKRLDHARVDGERRRGLVAELLEAALAWAQARGEEHPDTLLTGVPLTRDALRRELEQNYRALAKAAEDSDARHALVDRANAVRPRTLLGP
ncbi:serine/threonine-protein kinase PknG [Actinomadura pelletieri DSM 43383]|uniref:non-specific serine/threonine protein kinase n=1 Tax=Actinomadura pelletieri DSM 43383 TaxID=1120940 RepID=A0A495QXM7_9ACTN|nr:serine/threonine protein kinase [Actinomadura pelletieri]RKS78945.1 serine/threonine-protein kinase PknG [Actinomadura pelletieri DSM 43383]